MSRQKLLCSFITDSVKDSIEKIYEYYEVSGRIFILSLYETDFEIDVIATYSITEKKRGNLKKTISIHRKRETETLYTINALNYLIMKLNDGVMDENYILDWDNYDQSMLLTRGEEVIVAKTHLEKIF